jgi:hypothetical protein
VAKGRHIFAIVVKALAEAADKCVIGENCLGNFFSKAEKILADKTL